MRAIGFDTETTDLVRNRFRPLASQPHIIEFFGLVMEQIDTQTISEKGPVLMWSEADTFSSLFKPPNPITPEITKITGIDNDMVVDAPAFKECAHGIKRLIESCDIVFAHNLGFDKAMVDFEMKRCGLEVEWPKRMICTVEVTEHFLGRRMKLIELHQHLFGEPFEGAHRAENDVRPMVRCFKQLWELGTI